ncbi:MAG: hypothetical protein HYR66_12785 [Sphingobacteriales bacterium]|nr:hypothetical protein [Sphingobacteriales bacterium]MBI3720704.1 hypothetical protein [Sphingobacteriales bacterium]
MKKIICLCIIALIASNSSIFGQNINISEDSITTLLCKKWEINYVIMGGMKIERIPGATEINYEFNKDKTFLMTSDDPKDKTKGTWSFDPKKKIIRLTINGNSKMKIISIKEGELIMLADTKEATPGDPMEIKLYYKIKAK